MIIVSYTDLGMYIEHGEENILVPWKEIREQSIRDEIEGCILVHFNYSYGRSSSWQDSYILDRKEWANLKSEMMGRDVYMGEIAGKHSDVMVTIKPSIITEIEDIKEISNFRNIYGFSDCEEGIIGYYENNKEDGYYDDEE